MLGRAVLATAVNIQVHASVTLKCNAKYWAHVTEAGEIRMSKNLCEENLGKAWWEDSGEVRWVELSIDITQGNRERGQQSRMKEASTANPKQKLKNMEHCGKVLWRQSLKKSHSVSLSLLKITLNNCTFLKKTKNTMGNILNAMLKGTADVR